MVAVSSITSIFALPGMTVYTCTKAFLRYLFESLSFENGSKIDYLSLQPWLVETKMIS